MPHFSVNTWMGAVVVAFQESPFLVERIWLPGTFGTGAAGGRAQSAPAGNGAPASLSGARAVEGMIRAYFVEGKPFDIPWQWMRMDRLTPLQRRVLQVTARIPYGDLRTYKEIAGELGKPAAARFVGNTLAANPYPLFIPCHRVIRSDGSIGGFGGGAPMKAGLIRHESGSAHGVLAQPGQIC